MVFVIIICILSCLGMIVVTLIKPSLQIKKITINTYWIIVLLGAIILVISQSISFKDIFEGLTSDSQINPLKILILFISMTIISIFLDETGFFKYLANAVLRKTGSTQIMLFSALYVTISVVTIFTSNDIVILTFTPFICYFTKNAKINGIPYLVSGFVAANTTSMLLIIGNPTNIYLATSSNIIFLDYLKVMALPSLFAFIVAYVVMLLLFKNNLKEPISKTDEIIKIKDKTLLIIGLCLLLICTVLFVISSYINIQMWIIALVGVSTLIIVTLLIAIVRRQKPLELVHTLKRTPWELIFFIISMFVLILSLEKYNITTYLANILGNNNQIWIYGSLSTIFANLVNNIPMSVLFSSIIANLGSNINGAIYATIIGSNIGAFLTPIGALAGIMWLTILKKNEIKYSFAKFIMYGVAISVPVLFASLFGLWIVCY